MSEGYWDYRWHGPADAVQAAIAAEASVLGPAPGRAAAPEQSHGGYTVPARPAVGDPDLVYVAIRRASPRGRPAALSVTDPDVSRVLVGEWFDG